MRKNPLDILYGVQGLRFTDLNLALSLSTCLGKLLNFSLSPYL